MFPSLPKIEVLNEITRRINQETFKPNIKKDALKKLAKLSISYNSCKINGQYYEQAQGLFIGSPASPSFAELFIQRLEELSIYRMIHTPRLWLRKVDDTFAISGHETSDTLKELNEIHKDIQFTAEEEFDKKLPFLDCLISRKQNQTIETSVYKKKTHTGQYINFNSNQPIAVKLSTIKTLTRRANTICSNDIDLKVELEYIQRTMELNDFPKKLIQKTIKNTLNRETENKNKEDDNSIKLFLPYERGISEQITKMSKNYNVKVVHTKGKSLQSLVKENKSNQCEKEIQGAVYKVSCKDCDKFYIGETGRKLHVRINEHKRDARNKTGNMSGLSQHIVQYNHTVDWDNVEILYRENNFRRRKFKEAIAINKNINGVMNKKEEVKVLSNIWENLI